VIAFQNIAGFNQNSARFRCTNLPSGDSLESKGQT